MAPCSGYSSVQHIRISDKDNIRLRKPVVEKMRRDRINSCIEQLKVILEKEFHKQEPNSKLEKADILEMTVSFLRQQLQPGLSPRDYSRGYPHCWKDSVHFFSTGSSSDPSVGPLQGLQQQEQQQQLVHSHRASRSSTVCSSLRATTGPVWRPW
uniref:Transcription factor HES-5 n=1 Tax=Sphaeramia orbicularis TaxID=375764 RepID=A0A672ZHL4_9TELE